MLFYSIRPITAQDQPFLWEMLYESLYFPEGQQPLSRDVIKQPTLSKYLEEWGRPGDVGYIAIRNDDQPIGSITIRLFSEANKGYGFVNEETPELGMAVLADYRGKGIGTALMKTLLEQMKMKGLKTISLSVDPNNPAINLYRRFGFIEVGMAGTSLTMIVHI
jgi:GNAT superfamily N-acetyltransferase